MRLLILDDNPFIRRAVARIVCPTCELVECASVEEATHVLESTDVDIVVCDVHLRDGRSPPQVLGRLYCVMSRRTKLVVLTDFQDEVEPLGLGALHIPVVEKPFSPAQLRSAIRAVA